MKTLLSESFLDQLGGRNALQNKFPWILSLNVSDNPVHGDDLQPLINDILLLMPNVSDLQLSLFREQDVDMIIQRMPSLRTLNNIAVEETEGENSLSQGVE